MLLLLILTLGGIMYQYFIKVVPTVYHKLSGEVRSYSEWDSLYLKVTDISPLAFKDKPVLCDKTSKGG